MEEEVYSLLYRCRLCNKVWEDSWISTRTELMRFISNPNNTEDIYHYLVHECANGDLGISDIIGMTPEKIN